MESGFFFSFFKCKLPSPITPNWTNEVSLGLRLCHVTSYLGMLQTFWIVGCDNPEWGIFIFPPALKRQLPSLQGKLKDEPWLSSKNLSFSLSNLIPFETLKSLHVRCWVVRDFSSLLINEDTETNMAALLLGTVIRKSQLFPASLDTDLLVSPLELSQWCGVTG